MPLSSTRQADPSHDALASAPQADEHRGPVIVLPTVRTGQEIRQRLDRANRRGRLPEIEWLTDKTFRLELPSRPLVTYLLGSLVSSENAATGRSGDDQASGGVPCDLHLILVPRRRVLYAYLFFLVASVVVGTPLTDVFWPWMKIWWWGFPLGVLSVLWVAVRWPRASSSDAQAILPDWIGVIRQWLENGDEAE